MSIRAFEGITPTLGADVYVDLEACVIGEVVLEDDVSIWPMAVLRGDVNSIRIGKGSNIQDNCTLHVSHKTENQPEGFPLIIGDYVTIGHQVMLHGCHIGNYCLIGMGSIILDGAILEEKVMVGAGTLVPPGKKLESGFLYLGNPVKKVRPLTSEEIAHFEYSAKHYIKLKNQYTLSNKASPKNNLHYYTQI
jgi:carbonic anhydrase/acetyltransferase-like protein (isoleucine patch superfamily)